MQSQMLKKPCVFHCFRSCIFLWVRVLRKRTRLRPHFVASGREFRSLTAHATDPHLEKKLGKFGVIGELGIGELGIFISCGWRPGGIHAHFSFWTKFPKSALPQFPNSPNSQIPRGIGELRS